MAALKGRAESRGVVDQKGRFQHILTVLQFHVVMVDKAPVAAEIVDVLIHQHAGTKLWRKLIPVFLSDNLPQQACQIAGTVFIAAFGQNHREV